MRLIPRRRRVRQPGEARTAAPSAFRRTGYVGSRTVGLWLVAEPVGARWERPDDMTAEAFDAGFATFRADNLANELAATVYGEDYPAELEHYGMTTWWTLGQLVTHARLRPGDDLVDLACGRGGPALWSARATASNLVGVDWSPVAVAEASRRTPDFLPSGRARHIVGDLAATGLPDACSDMVICMDAVFLTPDRVAATTEVARILRPGGRYLFTSGERTRRDGDRHSIPDWTPLLQAGDLNLEHRIRVPKPRLGRSAPPSCETSLVPRPDPRRSAMPQTASRAHVPTRSATLAGRHRCAGRSRRPARCCRTSG